jgi:hypothetical protein
MIEENNWSFRCLPKSTKFTTCWRAWTFNNSESQCMWKKWFPSIIIPFSVNKPFLLHKHLFYWTSLFMDYLLKCLMRSLITTTLTQPYFTDDMQQMFQISTPKPLMTLHLISSTSTSKFFIYKFLKEKKTLFSLKLI